ncbi:hypothetical protein HNQ74_001272 [Bartonella doshiae]|uniref:Uncharacterized protein n=2 Tax=Bartonella doshiae TaxID=33044 RepID=A0A380ZEF2_BARDO|nr:hypothetical protein MCS_00910 [Bartonella doshiae NCTC 12862 = ATCC 700133]MBB6159832.1 hypothetical protein [Bartonella doshiae]SUV45348.1 Uncharacterised protein [Bartonella doshiae]
MCFCQIKQEWHYTEKIVMQNIAGFIGKRNELITMASYYTGYD